MSPRAVVFDLDGTLTDSAPGILASLRYCLTAMGVAHLDPAAERAFLGPPLHDSLARLLPADRLDEGVRHYRDYFVPHGMFENSVYDGVAAMLDELDDAGLTLAVATSKAQPFAVTILEHFGLAGRFAAIRGVSLSGSAGTKAQVVAAVLQDLKITDRASVVMVGDREHDVFGAAANGIACYGAGWGYGSATELQDAGAVAVFGSPRELTPVLRGRGGRPRR